MEEPKDFGIKNAPNAAIAEVKPVIAADSFSACRNCATSSAFGIKRATSLRMMLGIIWKVDALPTPVAKKRSRNIAKKPQNALGSSLMARKYRTPATPAIMVRKTKTVTRPPPQRSEIQPVAERESAPTRGPRKTNGNASTVGNCVFASNGKPAE